MVNTKAASRYAKSLVDLSMEQNALEDLKNDMVLFRNVVDENPQLEAILQNPIVPLDKKRGILSGTFDSHVHEITKSFFKLIVNKGRSSILFEVSKQFVKQYNALKGIMTASVQTATALTDENKKTIIETVKRELGANEVIIEEKINPSLIGGFIIKVGDKQFDASISGSLNKLKKQFAVSVN